MIRIILASLGLFLWTPSAQAQFIHPACLEHLIQERAPMPLDRCNALYAKLNPRQTIDEYADMDYATAMRLDGHEIMTGYKVIGNMLDGARLIHHKAHYGSTAAAQRDDLYVLEPKAGKISVRAVDFHFNNRANFGLVEARLENPGKVRITVTVTPSDLMYELGKHARENFDTPNWPGCANCMAGVLIYSHNLYQGDTHLIDSEIEPYLDAEGALMTCYNRLLNVGPGEVLRGIDAALAFARKASSQCH